MPKIAIIGAGSVTFAKSLLGDLASYRGIEDITLALMDVDPERLRFASRVTRRIADQVAWPVRVEATLDRREALRNADYVILAIHVGGGAARCLDTDISLKYGVKHSIGCTVGPGGIMSALRTIPILQEICRDMEELCPGAVLMNYHNPQAANGWALSRVSPINLVGLCHSVPHTHNRLCRFVGVPDEEVSFLTAGINHMAWILRFERNKEDLYPTLRRVMEDPEVWRRDNVRFEIFKRFGAFPTESSTHMSEYVPYFRRSAEMMERYELGTGIYAGFFRFKEYPKDQEWNGWRETAHQRLERLTREIESAEPIDLSRSVEPAAQVINAMETDNNATVYLNVPNSGLIDNLTQGCYVEVPCTVNRTGIHPWHIGALPPQLAALNMTNVNVHMLMMEAGLRRSKELAIHAAMVDPLTAAVVDLDQIPNMMTELFEAEEQWLAPHGYK
jgi:alpha-galactosidase